MSARPGSPFLLYFHTLRYLKPSQVLGRLLFRVLLKAPAAGPLPQLRPSVGAWTCPARAPSMLGPNRFRFLSVERDVVAADDWNREDWAKLWLYNLHYFNDLVSDDAPSRTDWHRRLISRWIAENPPTGGNGWEPYPVSLRLVNWVKWAMAGNPMEPAWIDSLARQARWLRSRLEWHLLGNHLLANAKALVFAGCFFAGPEAEAWRRKGLAILRLQLDEQILADGGHFERSPMYHAIILEDILDLIQLSLRWPGVLEPAMVAAWRHFATRMLRWLVSMTHPDGNIALFNDAAFGIAPDRDALLRYAAALEIDVESRIDPLLSLADSGYVRMEKVPAVLVADVGEIGPDYLPAHAHADTLSFELSLFGRRVIVNSGTSQYGLGPERLRQRGTAAHSTVQVDDADSSEVWSGFRVARRARPVGLEVEQSDGAMDVICAHDGYRRLKGRAMHRRHWRMEEGLLRVDDCVEGGFQRAVARYHLHPDVRVTGEGGEGLLCLPGGEEVRWSATGGEVRVMPSTWHPEFGRSVANKKLELVFRGSRASMEFSWK